MFSVYGIGNPLMDMVAYEDFSFIEKLGATKGTMNLITNKEKNNILRMITSYNTIPGGSCANTLRGIIWLNENKVNVPPVYNGAVGEDKIGKEYITQMEELGIMTRIVRRKEATGLSLVIVTPDYERTMFTYLGACRQFTLDDLDIEAIACSKYLHFTGYMWDTENQRKALIKAMDTAKQNNVKISFDIADPFVVERYKGDFLSWIPQKVDILFGNEEEIRMLLGINEEGSKLAGRASGLSPVIVMKAGKRGCFVNNSGEIIYTEGFKVNPVDTVGAGDFFASGFLFGFIKGFSLKICSFLGNKLASRIVEVEGCSLQKLNRDEILSVINRN